VRGGRRRGVEALRQGSASPDKRKPSPPPSKSVVLVPQRGTTLLWRLSASLLLVNLSDRRITLTQS
jgi:hypothetical protein